MKYASVTLGKSDPDDIWIRKQLIQIDPTIKDHDTESMARAMRALVLKLRGKRSTNKSNTKELILKCCASPKTQREIRTELGLSKSVVSHHIREMSEMGKLFNMGGGLWCNDNKPVKKSAKKFNAPTLTKWQPVQPWGIK